MFVTSCAPTGSERAVKTTGISFVAETTAWADGVESLMQPIEGSIEVPLLPGDGVESPDEHARRLDRWMAERDGEQVYHFAIENWWITDYMSLESHTPSDNNIQAVENTTYAVLYRDVQDELLTALPQLERYFRIILQRAVAAAQLRVKYIFTQTAEERYDHFSGQFPEFMQRVPQYMLASYLGFSPEFFSKIRAKKKT